MSFKITIKNFFVWLKNRSNITDVLEKYSLPESIIISDGHISYTVAYRNLNFIHYVVNLTEGFVNDDEYITNQAENLWRKIKKYYKQRNIIRRYNTKGSLFEFTWKYKYICPRKTASIINVFSSIINLIFFFVLKYLLTTFD